MGYFYLESSRSIYWFDGWLFASCPFWQARLLPILTGTAKLRAPASLLCTFYTSLNIKLVWARQRNSEFLYPFPVNYIQYVRKQEMIHKFSIICKLFWGEESTVFFERGDEGHKRGSSETKGGGVRSLCGFFSCIWEQGFFLF